jgi:hypothetical protein
MELKDIVANPDNLRVLVAILLPGFISYKVWQLIFPTEKVKFSDIVLELILFSMLNYICMSWLIGFALTESNEYLKNAYWFLIAIIAPLLWPFILKWFVNLKFLRGKIVHPTNSAWDYFFSQGKVVFIVVTLKNGELIGGLFSGNSFASSKEETFDIYIKEVWELAKDKRPKRRKFGTNGIWISKDSIDFIEFFEAQKRS